MPIEGIYEMISERAEYLMLTRKAEMMKKGYEPWKAAAVEEQAEEIHERLVYFEDLQHEILDLSSDKVAAGVIWAEITRDEGDSMQRVSTFASVLFAKELITREQFSSVVGKLRFIPNVTRTARQAAADEEKAMNDALDHVLKTVDRVNRDAARYEYNRLEGFRSWEKLNTWVKKLVELEMLPKSYLVGVRGGNTLQKMFRPGENKELKAGANK